MWYSRFEIVNSGHWTQWGGINLLSTESIVMLCWVSLTDKNSISRNIFHRPSDNNHRWSKYFSSYRSHSPVLIVFFRIDKPVSENQIECSLLILNAHKRVNIDVIPVGWWNFHGNAFVTSQQSNIRTLDIGHWTWIRIQIVGLLV